MSDKPKRWTWEEWELERKTHFEEVDACSSTYWNRGDCYNGFHANEPYIKYLEARVRELERDLNECVMSKDY